MPPGCRPTRPFGEKGVWKPLRIKGIQMCITGSAGISDPDTSPRCFSIGELKRGQLNRPGKVSIT